MKLTGGLETGAFIPKIASWNCSPGTGVPGEHDAIGRVEALHQLAAGLSQRHRQLAVDPHFGVVVHHQLEHHRHPGGVESADPLGDGDVDPVPVEAELSVPSPSLDRLRRESQPGRIVEVRGAGVGCDVVGAIGRTGGPEIGSGAAVLNLDEVGIAVAPLARPPARRPSVLPRLMMAVGLP